MTINVVLTSGPVEWHSYETCGYVNTYRNVTTLAPPLELQVTGFGLDLPPYTVPGSAISAAVKSTHRNILGSYGVMVSFFLDIVDLANTFGAELSFAPHLFFDISLAAKQSRWAAGSSVNEVIYDIAVGRFDLLASYVWILVDRAKLVNFLPTLGNAYFHFYASERTKQGTFWEDLEDHQVYVNIHKFGLYHIACRYPVLPCSDIIH